MISLRTHNILDTVIGAFLFLCPALFGFSTIDAARNLFVVLGAALIGYSLLTDYRYSIVRWIPVGIHMALDVAIGVMLLIGPSVFGYRPSLSPGQNTLHFVLGLGTIALVIFTKPRAAARKIPTIEEYRKAA